MREVYIPRKQVERRVVFNGNKNHEIRASTLLPGSPWFKSSTAPKKKNISKFQFDRMQDLPENHFRVSGASSVNITNYILLSVFQLRARSEYVEEEQKRAGTG